MEVELDLWSARSVVSEPSGEEELFAADDCTSGLVDVDELMLVECSNTATSLGENAHNLHLSHHHPTHNPMQQQHQDHLQSHLNHNNHQPIDQHRNHLNQPHHYHNQSLTQHNPVQQQHSENHLDHQQNHSHQQNNHDQKQQQQNQVQHQSQLSTNDRDAHSSVGSTCSLSFSCHQDNYQNQPQQNQVHKLGFEMANLSPSSRQKLSNLSSCLIQISPSSSSTSGQYSTNSPSSATVQQPQPQSSTTNRHARSSVSSTCSSSFSSSASSASSSSASSTPINGESATSAATGNQPASTTRTSQCSTPTNSSQSQLISSQDWKSAHSGQVVLLTEEERRTLLAEGYPIPQRFPLSKAEERSLKKIRRKIKNKISAQESRRKKKEYMEELEKRVQQMELRIVELERENERLASQLGEQTKLSAGTNMVESACAESKLENRRQTDNNPNHIAHGPPIDSTYSSISYPPSPVSYSSASSLSGSSVFSDEDQQQTMPYYAKSHKLCVAGPKGSEGIQCLKREREEENVEAEQAFERDDEQFGQLQTGSPNLAAVYAAEQSDFPQQRKQSSASNPTDDDHFIDDILMSQELVARAAEVICCGSTSHTRHSNGSSGEVDLVADLIELDYCNESGADRATVAVD